MGIIGYGHFGAFLAELGACFLPQTQIKISSSRKVPDGTTFFSFEEVCQCDWVILAVPIAAFKETLARVVSQLGSETVIVDVATVKSHTLQALKELAPDKRYIATHPMFGPESYKKRGNDVRGLRVVICEHTITDEEAKAFGDALASVGFDVVTMTADQHDRHLARTLFLTHLVGQIIAHAGFDRTEIDTVSFGYLMDAVESVKYDEALFRDVFRFNPYCADVLAEFQQAERGVVGLVEGEHAREPA